MHVIDSVLWFTSKIRSATRATTFCAQASTSRRFPRSRNIVNTCPPKRPYRSVFSAERAELLGELHEQIFARDRADSVLDLAEFVRADEGERADAALRFAVQAIREHLEEAAPVIEARGRILVHRLLDELLGLGLPLAGLAGHAELDGGVAVVGRGLDHELERNRRAARVERGRL